MPPNNTFPISQLKNGSLLNRPKAVLEKLAAMSNLNPNAPRNSRNFVFQTLSPVKTEASRETSKAQVARLIYLSRVNNLCWVLTFYLLHWLCLRSTGSGWSFVFFVSKRR